MINIMNVLIKNMLLPMVNSEVLIKDNLFFTVRNKLSEWILRISITFKMSTWLIYK